VIHLLARWAAIQWENKNVSNSAEHANRLAIEGGEPVRKDPLPWELPGVHWIGDEEAELVDRVIKAKSPFRYYGPDLQHMVDTLESEWREKYDMP
jgi:hypothetical protein